MKKTYTKGNVSVLWEPEKCIHSEKCFKSLPRVFNPKRKPWVDLEQSTDEKIIEAVRNCPSQALSLKEEIVEDTPMTEIQVLKNGPVLVKGKISIEIDGKKEVLDQNQIALCRCGASNNKPYCDGAHSKINFEAL
ncbi:(4Fe-4S)-binding protein [Flammeovirga sp. EKP202]|uniref:(4Fe-4S)-binding protein n=1 Tax=Flammeovirga sp. EKP202 TaxID=2770592 RepID=UPI00165F7EBD|nr:(4Fe-4S)-binding protein [Flammeovirga sp. EKP202]MBD0403797.1 (4Fe-4S)-binding protein [Flammeovirga sp. EKP202]